MPNYKILATALLVAASLVVNFSLVIPGSAVDDGSKQALNVEKTQKNEVNNLDSSEVSKVFSYEPNSLYDTQIPENLFDNVGKPFIVQAKGKDKRSGLKFTVTALTDNTIKIDSNRKAKIFLNLVKTKDKSLRQNHKKTVKLQKGSNIINGLESGRTYQVKYGYNAKTKKYRKFTKITPIKQTNIVESAFIEKTTNNSGIFVTNVNTHWSMGAEQNRKIFWKTLVADIDEKQALIKPFEYYNEGQSYLTRNEVNIPDSGFLQVDIAVANPLGIKIQRMWSVAPVELIKEAKLDVINLTTNIPDMQKYADLYNGLYTNGQLFKETENSYNLASKYIANALENAKKSASGSL